MNKTFCNVTCWVFDFKLLTPFKSCSAEENTINSVLPASDARKFTGIDCCGTYDVVTGAETWFRRWIKAGNERLTIWFGNIKCWKVIVAVSLYRWVDPYQEWILIPTYIVRALHYWIQLRTDIEQIKSTPSSSTILSMAPTYTSSTRLLNAGKQ